MTNKALRVLTYSRCSTAHHDQKPEVQVHELRRYCAARGWDIAEEIVDHGFSGGTDQRPGLKQLMALVRARRVDAVVVTKLDRMARSLKHLLSLLDEFSSLGIQFVSVGDQIDFGSASGRLMFSIFGAFSEFERALIRERTVAGLAHARAKGVRFGRPQIHDPEAIRYLRSQGLSYRAISNRLKVPMGTITQALKSAQNVPPKIAKPKAKKSGN